VTHPIEFLDASEAVRRIGFRIVVRPLCSQPVSPRVKDWRVELE
jgi:hypothetical protein